MSEQTVDTPASQADATEPAAPEQVVEPTAPETAETGAPQVDRVRRKTRYGTVVSAKGDKTIVVRAERNKSHPLYGKTIALSKKFHAHDPDNQAAEGDIVWIRETRPLSKLKCWELVEIVQRHEED